MKISKITRLRIYLKNVFNKKPLHDLFILLGVIFIIWLVVDIFLFFLFKSTKGSRGTFGDMFGAINSLFSGLALGGIIYSIHQQSKELGLQREELKLSREELKLTRIEFSKQSDEFKSQNDILKIQRFENTVFNLLKLFNESVTTIEHIFYEVKRPYIGNSSSWNGNYISNIYVDNDIESSTKLPVKGREFFKICYEILKKDLDNSTIDFNKIVFFQDKALANVHVRYFKSLYNLLKIIDDLDLFDDKEITKNKEYEFKHQYIEIAKSQLSSFEFFLLFYYCLSIYDLYKFRPLLEKYAFFKEMPLDVLLDIPQNHRDKYKKEAFGFVDSILT